MKKILPAPKKLYVMEAMPSFPRTSSYLYNLYAWCYYDLCLKILFVVQSGGLRVRKTLGEPAYRAFANQAVGFNQD
jgi:hypothetical protein